MPGDIMHVEDPMVPQSQPTAYQSWKLNKKKWHFVAMYMDTYDSVAEDWQRAKEYK